MNLYCNYPNRSVQNYSIYKKRSLLAIQISGIQILSVHAQKHKV